MDPFKIVDVHVWAGGRIVWTPNIRYVGGLNQSFCMVEFFEICYFDFSDWYQKTTKKQVSNPNVYYILPNEEAIIELRKIASDDDIRNMQKDLINEQSLHVWIEEDGENPYLNEQGQHPSLDTLVSVGDQADQRNGEHYDDEELDEQTPIVDGAISDVDDNLAEDFEGPEDDDIFVERPEDHSVKELMKYKTAIRAEERKKEMNRRRRRRSNTTTNNNNNEDQGQDTRPEMNTQGGSGTSTHVQHEEQWHTDDGTGSDEELNKKVDSDDEKPIDVFHEYEEFKEKNYPDMKNFEMTPGMLFSSRAVFRQVLRDWVITKGWDLRFSKSEKNIFSAFCKAGCDWRIRASTTQGSNTFQVKTIRGEHTCPAATRNSQANYKYLGMNLVEHLRDCPDMSLQKLKRKVSNALNLEVSDHVIYRAKRYGLRLIEGDIKVQYSKLFDYRLTLCNENVGSSLRIELNHDFDPPSLKMMYFGLNGLRDGFLAGCRPIIGLDGCFLKGVYGGQLLSAVARDGNDNLYPIAMGLVMMESYQSWKWFLENLRSQIGTVEEKGWAFISDRQKGLLEAVADVFPGAEHRFCVRHMYNNFKTKFKGLDMKKLFWRAASVGNVHEFNKVMNEIKETYPAGDDNEVTPYVWLNRIESEHWARSHFPTRTKCATIVNNMSESFNAYIMGARDLPIISMWEWIRNKFMTRIQVKKAGMEKYQGLICPNILRKMRKDRLEYGRNCYPTFAGEDEYSVEFFNQIHVVKLDERTCSCGMFQLQGYPCCHAISAIELHRKDLSAYVSDWYTKEKYLATYGHMIHPVPGMKFFENSGEGSIQPPVIPVKLGRPQKERKKDANDIRDPTKASRKGHQKTCSKCLGQGHNYLSCKNPIHIKSKFFKGCETSSPHTNQGGPSQAFHTSPNQPTVPNARKATTLQKNLKKQPTRGDVYVVQPPPQSVRQNSKNTRQQATNGRVPNQRPPAHPTISTPTSAQRQPPAVEPMRANVIAPAPSKRQKKLTETEVMARMKERKRGHHPL